MLDGKLGREFEGLWITNKHGPQILTRSPNTFSYTFLSKCTLRALLTLLVWLTWLVPYPPGWGCFSRWRGLSSWSRTARKTRAEPGPRDCSELFIGQLRADDLPQLLGLAISCPINQNVLKLGKRSCLAFLFFNQVAEVQSMFTRQSKAWPGETEGNLPHTFPQWKATKRVS